MASQGEEIQMLKHWPVTLASSLSFNHLSFPFYQKGK